MATTIPAWIDGTLTPVEKLATHRRGLRHKAVSVFVLHEGAVLIQRRALDKYHTPGLWANTCCTHPEWSETPEHCADRRLYEELGISGLSPVHRGQVEYRADVGGGLIEHELVDVFVANVETRPTVLPNPDEVMDVAWIPYADLVTDVTSHPDRYSPWLRIYLDDFAETIFQPCEVRCLADNANISAAEM